MGDSFSKECNCGGLCGPGDPNAEELSTINTRPNTTKYSQAPAAKQEVEPSYRNEGYTDHEPLAPPTSSQDHSQEYAQVPTHDAGGGDAGGSLVGSITLDDILSDLERTEERVYGEAWENLTGGAAEVGYDHTMMREFVIANSALTMDSLDQVLFTEVPDPPFNKKAFLKVLRAGALEESHCISDFLGLSGDGENIAVDECRTGLVMFAQQHLGDRSSEDDRDRVLTTVMMTADVMVNMESWVAYCKQMARIVRLAKYCQIH